VKITVDLDRCRKNAQCVYSAPDLFDMDEDQNLTWVSEPDDSFADEAQDAAAACPVQAISVG
jgi:ferredoxin